MKCEEIRLEVLERHHMPVIIKERNKILEVLRTPFLINESMQNEPQTFPAPFI